MADKKQKSKGRFQQQLESAALRKIVLLVVCGCLLFCVPLFGMNVVRSNLRAGAHLDFLSETFGEMYHSTESFLTDSANEEMFLRALCSGSEDNEVRYALSRFNVSAPARIQLILSNTRGTCAYSSFSAQEFNLHRRTFNEIVTDNALAAGGLYNAVYFFSGDTSEYVFCLPLYSGDALSGFVTAYVNSADWGRLLSSYQYDAILTNLNGDVIYCSKSGFLPERNANKFRESTLPHELSVNGTRYLVSARVLENRRAVLYSFIYAPSDLLYFLVGTLCIMLIGGISFAIFRRMSQMMAAKSADSVSCLVDEIRIIRKGDNTHVIQIETGDEFEEIAVQINKMVRSINELNTRNTDLITLNSAMEMRNLQAQINPHFVYNTLDTIKYLTLSDPDRAAELIENFTGLLRYSINNTKQEVRLAEDMERIRDYLTIQHTRFGERFVCVMDIDAACGDFLIPKLLLQPLLENSIKYGFRKRTDIAVRVTGRREGSLLELCVCDNGPGVSAQKLAELRGQIGAERLRTEHNGLQNIARRILLRYAPGSGLEIDSTENESFTVTVRLCQKEEKDVSGVAR